MSCGPTQGGSGHVAFERQVGELVERVDLAQLRIELQAVDHHRWVQQAHMFGPQVAVAFDQALAHRALLQQVSAARQALAQPVEGRCRAGQRPARVEQQLAAEGQLVLETAQVLVWRHARNRCTAVEGREHGRE